MALVSAPRVREACANILGDLSSRCSDIISEQFSIELLDDLGEILLQRQKGAESDVNAEHEVRLSIGHLGVLATASFAVLFADSRLPRVTQFPSFGESRLPDADLLLHGLLSSISSHSLAVLKLVRSGLEPPARIVLRNVHELTWLTIVLSADGEALRLFAHDLPDDEERRLFWSHFSAAKLNARLERIERGLGLPDDISSSLRGSRVDAYTIYSKTVHNAYPSIMLGLVNFSLTRTGYAAFGMATEASNSTLESLASALFYFLGLFFEVIRRVHSFLPPYVVAWQEAFAAREAFLGCYAGYIMGTRARRRTADESAA